MIAAGGLLAGGERHGLLDSFSRISRARRLMPVG
jgi:hypothetical protein